MHTDIIPIHWFVTFYFLKPESNSWRFIMHEILDWIYSIVVALCLAMIIHIFLFVPTKVSGNSMYPTLTNGEYLIVSKISHVFREVPQYGDIVIIDSRTHRERSWVDDMAEPMQNYIAIFNRSSQEHNVWVKRVIGKGGDTLAFHDGHVYRNGEKLEEPYINEPMEFSMDGTYTVPEGTVFVMGDNRNHSSDSRFIGPVPVDHVLGKVAIQF